MTKREIAKLREVRDMLTTEHMETCSFRFNDPAYSAEIAEATRIWRSSWILPVLDEILSKYDPTILPVTAREWKARK